MIKFYCNYLIIICGLLLVISNRASAQTNEFQEKVNEIVREKLRTEEPDLLQNNTNNIDIQTDKRHVVRSVGNETQVTDTNIAESEVHAAINPIDSNNIVLSPIRLIPYGGFTLPIYFTRDFGKTWKQSEFLPKPIPSNYIVVGGGDPAFAYDSNGKVYYTWIDLIQQSTSLYHWALYWAYSDDGGENWVQPDNPISFSSGSSLYSLPAIADKQWMSTDKSNSAYKGSLYVAFVKMNLMAQTQRIVLARKPADSNFFIPTHTEISNSDFTTVQFASIVVDNSGFIHVSFYGSKNGGTTYGLYHAISKNGGLTFSEPNLISQIIKMSSIRGVQTSRLYPSPYMEVDNGTSIYKGNLYITWTSTGITYDEGNGSNIYFSKSSDSGTTWSFPSVVNDDPLGSAKDQLYSSISVNSKGIITISWYDARHSKSNSTNEIVQYYLAHSFDGGISFKPNYNVSSAFSNFATIGSKNNSFGIGEYTQVLSTDGYAIPIWSDGRKGDGDLDIYVAFSEITANTTGLQTFNAVTENVVVKDLWPNPATNNINLSFSLLKPSDIMLEILSVEGKIVFSEKKGKLNPNSYSFTLNTEQLNEGSYFIRLNTSDGMFLKNFIVVKK